MRIAAVLAAAVVVACGGGGEDVPDGALCIDCDRDPPDGGGAGAFTWRLEARDATTLYGFEDLSPLAEGRSTRVAVEHVGLSCDLGAMPLVEVTAASRTVRITTRAFVRTPACTLTAGQTRIVTLALTAGAWTVSATGAPSPITITVDPPPGRACGAAPCSLDCDCDVAAGERCLGATGFAGAFTACVRPCEHDRDCGGGGACLDLADGHFRTCSDQDECSAAYPCPTGFDCSLDLVCDPTFVLNQSTRIECASDQDCQPGLRCVEATSGSGPDRCEVACRTSGAWCQGAHVCGPASADLANLARSDSVCGSLGE